jgi:GntR family transcriptional regulator
MPLFADIEKDLADKIQRGVYAAGESIPTELKLCEIYGVSRITVRRAVDRLVAARMIYRRRGLGTFVRRRERDQASLQLFGYMPDVLSFDERLTTRIFQRGPRRAPPTVCHAFDVHESERLYTLAAVCALDGAPCSVSYAYLAPSLTGIGPRIHMTDGQASIRAIEALTDLRARSGVQTVKATSAAAPVASRLGVPGGTALLTTMRTYFADGARPLEVVIAHHHPDRYSVRVELLGADSHSDRPRQG